MYSEAGQFINVQVLRPFGCELSWLQSPPTTISYTDLQKQLQQQHQQSTQSFHLDDSLSVMSTISTTYRQRGRSHSPTHRKVYPAPSTRSSPSVSLTQPQRPHSAQSYGARVNNSGARGGASSVTSGGYTRKSTPNSAYSTQEVMNRLYNQTTIASRGQKYGKPVMKKRGVGDTNAVGMMADNTAVNTSLSNNRRYQNETVVGADQNSITTRSSNDYNRNKGSTFPAARPLSGNSYSTLHSHLSAGSSAIDSNYGYSKGGSGSGGNSVRPYSLPFPPSVPHKASTISTGNQDWRLDPPSSISPVLLNALDTANRTGSIGNVGTITELIGRLDSIKQRIAQKVLSGGGRSQVTPARPRSLSSGSGSGNSGKQYYLVLFVSSIFVSLINY